MKEKRLVEKLKEDDTEALSKIMDIYTPYAYTIICNICGTALSSEDIEETLSDCFLCLWENRAKAEAESLKAYIASIARSKALDRLRRLKIVLPLEDNVEILQCQDPEAEVIINELASVTREAVETLAEPDREIFKRHYFLFETSDSIAESMKLNPSTVRTRLSRGRVKLRGYLEEKGYEYENTAK